MLHSIRQSFPGFLVVNYCDWNEEKQEEIYGFADSNF